MSDHALDALLAEYTPPPVPAGLAARVAEAALALPQAPRPIRAAPRHNRRAAWLRRPLLLGGVALGLAVSGGLAASLIGVRLDRLPLVEAVLAKFVDREQPPAAAPPPELAPAVIEPGPVQESPTPAPREASSPPPPRAVPARDEAPPPALPEPAPPPPEAAPARPIELPPALPLPPPPPIAVEVRPVATPIPEPRAGEEVRLQQARIERADRLRAARQAQIERLQRIQQRRERIRRLRRD